MDQVAEVLRQADELCGVSHDQVEVLRDLDLLVEMPASASGSGPGFCANDFGTSAAMAAAMVPDFFWSLSCIAQRSSASLAEPARTVALPFTLRQVLMRGAHVQADAIPKIVIGDKCEFGRSRRRGFITA